MVIYDSERTLLRIMKKIPQLQTTMKITAAALQKETLLFPGIFVYQIREMAPNPGAIIFLGVTEENFSAGGKPINSHGSYDEEDFFLVITPEKIIAEREMFSSEKMMNFFQFLIKKTEI